MLKALAVAIVGALLLGGACTPAVYSLLDRLYDTVPWPYSRVFNRVTMLALVLLLLAQRRQIRWVGRTKQALRAEQSGRWARIGLGLVLTIGSALAIVPLLVLRPEIGWSERTAASLSWSVVRELPAAVAVGLIEESFFRVLIFGALRRAMPLLPALGISSGFYAWVHFLSSDRSWIFPGWSWWIGFDYLGGVLAKTTLPGLLPSMFGLLLVGLALCHAYHRLGALSLAIGMHGGWFIAAKFCVFATALLPGHSLPTGLDKRYFLVGQPWTWLSVLLVIGALELLYRRRGSYLPAGTER